MALLKVGCGWVLGCDEMDTLWIRGDDGGGGGGDDDEIYLQITMLEGVNKMDEFFAVYVETHGKILLANGSVANSNLT